MARKHRFPPPPGGPRDKRAARWVHARYAVGPWHGRPKKPGMHLPRRHHGASKKEIAATLGPVAALDGKTDAPPPPPISDPWRPRDQWARMHALPPAERPGLPPPPRANGLSKREYLRWVMAHQGVMK